MRSPRLDLYFIAIGGTGMAPLACLLKERGHRVSGSDGPLYPPMSTLLEAAGIEPLVGYDPARFEPAAGSVAPQPGAPQPRAPQPGAPQPGAPRPDLVIVGNAVRRSNPEAEAVERLGLPRISMPEALARFFLEGRRPLVVAGTHGKTTTTAMAAWAYAEAGADPGYLIGGLPRNLERSFAIGSGPRFILEGDEYNAAYFDRGPKFLHYRPQTLILTSVEYDHVDLYPDPETLREAYRRVVRLLPRDGLLVACGDSAEVRAVAELAKCRVVFYGLGRDNEVRPLQGVASGPDGSRFAVADPEAGEVELAVALPGDHNVSNALAVWTAARHDGLGVAALAAALRSFRGVKRRLEELGSERGVTVVDDFAHHPTAVGESLKGLRRAYPGRRLVALFEPRSLTAGRAFLFDAYLAAFAHADVVYLAPLFHRDRLEPEERLDLAALARRLEAVGTRTRACASVDEVLSGAVEGARRGDVLVAMSSGAFEGLPRRLLAALAVC